MNTMTAAIPQEDRAEEPKKVLRLAKQPIVVGDTIQNLVRNRWYVPEDAGLLDLADDLNNYPSIPAVAVTDSGCKLLGLIIRQDLLDLLGRPFGRDVLQKENVVRVAQNSKTFRQEESIISVSEQIGHDDLAAQQGYFPVKSSGGEYSGIFSVQDLLVHLSGLSRENTVLAGNIHHRLVKELQILETPEYDILAATFRSANPNGDFSYIRQYGKNTWTIGLCSTPAEGVVGNMMATMLWGVINTYDFSRGLVQFVRQLNGLILKSFENPVGVNGLFMDFQASSGGLTLCDHGNGAGYIWRKGQFLKMKTAAETTSLGTRPELNTEIFRYQLKAGDLVFLMNNSLASQQNKAGECYGPDRLRAVLEENPKTTIRNLRGLIHADFKAFRAGSNLTNDASLVIIDFRQPRE